MKSNHETANLRLAPSVRALVSVLVVFMTTFPSCGNRGGRAESKDEAHEAHGAGAGEHADADVITLTADAVAMAEVATVPAARRTFRTRLTATGEIAVNDKRMARVVSRSDGWVQTVRRFAGDRVKTGDILVEVVSPSYQTVVTDLLLAVERLGRARRIGDAQAIEAAQAIVKSARGRLRLYGESDAEIDRIIADGVPPAVVHVHAPLSGAVLTSQAIPGHAVEPGGELFTIADLETVWASLDLFEKDLARITLGAPVRLAVAAYPDEGFEGRVTLVSSVMDEATRTVKVRVEVPNPGGRLRPGMFVTASIVAGAAHEGVAVPETAVQEEGEERYVFVAEDGGRFRRQVIETGARDSGFLEVVAGLEPGTTVVSEGAFALKSELLKAGFEAGHEH